MSIRNFCITIGGGLGDQACAEPVIRWMTENFYKKDNIILMTHYPEIFSHLPVECCSKKNLKLNETWITCKTHNNLNEDDIYCFIGYTLLTI